MNNEFGIRLLTTEETFDIICKKIENCETGRYIRFGDGDFNLFNGQADMLARTTKELQDAFINTFKNLKESDLISVNYHCKEYGTLEPGMKPGVHENTHESSFNNIKTLYDFGHRYTCLYSHIALHHTMSENPIRFKDIINIIRNNNHSLILHTNNFDPYRLSYWFGCHYSVTCSPRDSFLEKDRIINDISTLSIDKNRYLVVILGMGCGGRAMIDNIEIAIKNKTSNYFILDIGSPIDILMEYKNTRAWMEISVQVLKPISIL